MVRNNLVHRHTHERAYHMSAYEVAWLCERTIHDPINEYRRRPEGTDQEQRIGIGELFVVEQANETDAEEGAEESPEMVFEINQCLFIDDVTDQSCVTLNPFSQNRETFG